MKLNLTYGATFELIIATSDGNFTYVMNSRSLQDAVNYAEKIFDGETPLRGDAVFEITICDANTGEICAECEPDSVEKVGFDNPNYSLNQ